MGSQTKYNAKELVYVNIVIPNPATEGNEGTVGLLYGFFTNIPPSNRTELGHVAITPAQYADPPQGLVMGCSFPKPRRAGKRETNRYTSSYVSQEKIAAAKKAGYRVSPSRGNSKINLSAASFVQTVYVSMRGVKYGWNIPKVTLTNAGDLTGLGVTNAVAGDRDELCFGANFPKPPQASIIKANGDEIKVVRTFYDPSKNLPAGWTPAKPGRISI